MSSQLFPARYPGECTECGDLFDEGDWIAYLDDEIVCELCYKDALDDDDDD